MYSEDVSANPESTSHKRGYVRARKVKGVCDESQTIAHATHYGTGEISRRGIEESTAKKYQKE